MSAGCTHTACSLLAAHLHTISRPRPRGVSRPWHLPQQHGRPVLLPRHAFSPPTYALITPVVVDDAEIHVSFLRSFVSPSFSLLFPHFNICSQPYQTVCRLSSGTATRTSRRPPSGRAGSGREVEGGNVNSLPKTLFHGSSAESGE